MLIKPTITWYSICMIWKKKSICKMIYIIVHRIRQNYYLHPSSYTSFFLGRIKLSTVLYSILISLSLRYDNSLLSMNSFKISPITIQKYKTLWIYSSYKYIWNLTAMLMQSTVGMSTYKTFHMDCLKIVGSDDVWQK